MRWYIAARFDRCNEMNGYAQQLRQSGHIVDCRWLQGLHQIHPGAAEIESGGFSDTPDGIPMIARPFAEDDVQDIKAADGIILFSEPPSTYSKRGGRHVEFGLAMGLGKTLVVIGPRENVFHCLPFVYQFTTWALFMETIQGCVS
jgi:hypothetical protein